MRDFTKYIFTRGTKSGRPPQKPLELDQSLRKASFISHSALRKWKLPRGATSRHALSDRLGSSLGSLVNTEQTFSVDRDGVEMFVAF